MLLVSSQTDTFSLIVCANERYECHNYLGKELARQALEYQQVVTSI